MGRVDCEFRSTFDRFYSKLSGLRDGGLAGAEAKDETLSFWGVEFHSRAIVGSARIGLVVDFSPELYLFSSSLSVLDSMLRHVNAIQASLNDWLECGRRRLVYSIWKLCKGHGWTSLFNASQASLNDWLECGRRRLEYSIWKLCKGHGWTSLLREPSEASIPSYAVVVSAVVLLSLVYQYLTGNVDTGSSKAYSRSSLDFRDIYVAVVLFLGAYVWIKFREVAHLRGVRRRVVKRGRITKLVYDARLNPPKWNGEAVPKLELGQFATEQEAHNKFRIAAFYYNRDAGLLDGWFQVPPMSEDERSFTGLALRAWVIGQAKRVYEDFQKKEAALLLQELLEGEVNVDFSIPSLLNPDEHQQPALACRVENNLGMAMAMVDDQGLEWASFGGMHESLALPNGQSLGSTLPVPQLPPITESGTSLNGSDQWDLFQTLTCEASLLNSAEDEPPLLVSPAENLGQGLECASQSVGGMHEGFVTSNGDGLGFQEESAIVLSRDTQSGMCIDNSNQLNLPQIVQNQQELITYLRQKLQERDTQISGLENEKRIQQQRLDESTIRISQFESQHFVEQQLQVINQGYPSLEVEMEQSTPEQNHSCKPHGSAFR